MASEEQSKKAHQAQREAEAERRLAEKERQERTAESLRWREKHQDLADRFRAQEDLKALRQNKAVRTQLLHLLVCYPHGLLLNTLKKMLTLFSNSVRPTSRATSCA